MTSTPTTPTTPAVTVERIDDADTLARYDITTRDVLYRVSGRRVSGVVAAQRNLSGESAPRARAFDPHRGYWSGDRPTASYAGVWLTASPRGKGTGWDSTDDERHPDALTANGRRITDASRHVQFSPVAVDESDGVTGRNRWHTMTVDAARADAARYGYVFADNVPGTDGRRVSGVFLTERGSFDRGLTYAGSRVLDAVTNAVIVDMFTRGGIDAALIDVLAASVSGDINTADERAERWQTRAAELRAQRAAIVDHYDDADTMTVTCSIGPA